MPIGSLRTPLNLGTCLFRSPSIRLLLFLAALLLPAPSFAVKRDTIKEMQEEYAGRAYQLRIDLRGTDFFAAFNVLTDQGAHYRGRELAIIFYRMETVYLDRISNESEREIRLSIYRNRNDARRDLSTEVILEVRAGKKEPSLQREQITALMGQLFYLKETPTYEQKEAFILSHRDLPLQRLTSITGFGEDQVRGILMKGEARK
jgi:hypothetical protein